MNPEMVKVRASCETGIVMVLQLIDGLQQHIAGCRLTSSGIGFNFKR